VDRTLIAKILPPTRSPAWIARPRLTGRIEAVAGRRLTVVEAEAGFGKTALLTSWWESATCAWYTVDSSDRDLLAFARRLSESLRLHVPDLPAELVRPGEGLAGPEPEQVSRADALAARLSEVLHDRLTSDLVLIVDDAHDLVPAVPATRMIEALCRQAPGRLHLVLAGRRRPPFPIERLRGRSELIEIGADLLAFDEEEIASLLQAQLGTLPEGLPATLHRRTGGWPAAIMLAVEALRESPAERWSALIGSRADARLFSYLAEEVLANQPAEVLRLLSTTALLEQFRPALCDALGLAPSGPLLADLLRRGLFVEERQDGSLALRPLTRDYVLANLPLPPEQAVEVRARAAEWLSATGHAAAALRLLVQLDEPGALVPLLEGNGPAILNDGEVSLVLEACRSLPVDRRTAAIEQLEGDVLQVQGDWAGALSCFERASAGSAGVPARLAWRKGLIHYLRGELDAALEAYGQGVDDEGAEPGEMALLLAWMATAYWLRGDTSSCRQLAGQAFDLASVSKDNRALAAAHTALAMLAALDGDRRGNDAHYLLALKAADEAGDVLQIIRIRTNRGSHFIEEGAYEEGLQELDLAIRLAEMTSVTSFLDLSLLNRGQARFHMGQLDEALADFEASRARCEQIGSDAVAYSLVGIGDVYRERGNLAQARAAYEEAVKIAEACGDVQGAVPALANLATVVAGEDPDQAKLLAERAIGYGSGLGYVQAVLAGGWVAAHSGDLEGAAMRAGEAVVLARARRDRAGLAEALALSCLTSERPRLRAEELREAASIWASIGDPLGEARAAIALDWLKPEPASTTSRIRAERVLESHGLRLQGGNLAAGLLSLVTRVDARLVRLLSLGGFSVVRGGEVVKTSEWQSRRARELLKLLVARRGRPVPRAVLMDALWPDEDEERLSNRLSVALTTVRSILDPSKQSPADEFVRADRDAVALNLGSVDVDLERFLASASAGLDRLRRGDDLGAMPLLEAAEATYSGDFLEENPYDDWAAPVREEARAAYIAVARALAENFVTRGEPDAATRYLLRILEADPYDEDAHLRLVRALSDARRYGEAHRHYLGYRRAMKELGVEPVVFPGSARPPARGQG